MSKAADADVDAIFAEVRQQQKMDEAMRHVDRLTKPGAKYFNLNPFEVLELPYTCDEEDVKKKYRLLSTYLHPDKNPHEKASDAFDIVRGAYGTLIDDAKRKEAMEIAQEAKRRLDEQWSSISARKKARVDEPKSSTSAYASSSTTTDKEQDPEYQQELRKYVCKLFAEIARKNYEREHRARETARAEKEKEAVQQAISQAQTQYNKEWEAGRDTRVQGWRSFVGKRATSSTPEGPAGNGASDVVSPKTAKNPGAIDLSHPTQTIRVGFRPPKLTPETRPASANQPNPAASSAK